MIGGAITFNEKGQNVNLPSATVQNRNGRPTVVLPAENAELKPVFPMPGLVAAQLSARDRRRPPASSRARCSTSTSSSPGC